MSDGFSEENKKLLLNGLMRMKKDIEAMNKKKVDKDKILRSYEEHEFKYYLNKKNMKELHELRRALDIRNASSLTKHKLIDVLFIAIVKNLDYILRNLWGEDINLVKEILAGGGVIEVDNEHEMEALDKWAIGVVETKNSKKIGIIPHELRAELEKILKKNNLIKRVELKQYCFEIIKGKLFYYGVLKASQIFEIIKDLKVPIDEYEVVEYIFHNSNCGRGIEVDYSLFSHELVLEPQSVYDEQQKRNINYIEVSKEKALKASKDGYYEWNEYHREFDKYLIKKYNLTIMRAAEIVNQCDYKVKNDFDFGQIINELSMEMEIPNMTGVHELAKYIQDIYNNTSMWMLKGHAPSDFIKKEKN